MIQVIEVKTRKQKKLFATFPLKLYRDCKNYVPSLRSDEMNTLNPKKNFSLSESEAKCFLAYKDGELVGRIAGIIHNTYNNMHDVKKIRFSRFEAINDLEVFRALLDKVAEYGRENGMDTMHGPWGFNDTDREGMLTEGFDLRSTYATNYYYPYFSENMVKLGFEDESKWVEKNFEIPTEINSRISAMAEKVRQKENLIDVSESMSIRKIVKKYGDELFITINQAYGHLDGYVPVVGRAKENVLSQFATICNRKYLSILVNEKGEVAGFGIVLPSIADALVKSRGKLFPLGFIRVLKSISRPKELEMALIGVKPEYKNSGISAMIIEKVLKGIVEGKIERLESNPMLETNVSILNTWKFTECETVKKRQTYQKKI